VKEQQAVSMFGAPVLAIDWQSPVFDNLPFF
jgi:hypothetical protein